MHMVPLCGWPNGSLQAEEVLKLFKVPHLGMYAARCPEDRWISEVQAQRTTLELGAESVSWKLGPAWASASCIIDLPPGHGRE